MMCKTHRYIATRPSIGAREKDDTIMTVAVKDPKHGLLGRAKERLHENHVLICLLRSGLLPDGGRAPNASHHRCVFLHSSLPSQ